jgi:hypothetical protein
MLTTNHTNLTNGKEEGRRKKEEEENHNGAQRRTKVFVRELRGPAWSFGLVTNHRIVGQEESIFVWLVWFVVNSS